MEVITELQRIHEYLLKGIGIIHKTHNIYQSQNRHISCSLTSEFRDFLIAIEELLMKAREPIRLKAAALPEVRFGDFYEFKWTYNLSNVVELSLDIVTELAGMSDLTDDEREVVKEIIAVSYQMCQEIAGFPGIDDISQFEMSSSSESLSDSSSSTERTTPIQEPDIET